MLFTMGGFWGSGDWENGPLPNWGFTSRKVTTLGLWYLSGECIKEPGIYPPNFGVVLPNARC